MKETAKSVLKTVTPVWLRQLYHSARQYLSSRKLLGPRTIRIFSEIHPDAHYVQIGSNDGKKHDPLYQQALSHRWRGLLVEPVPYVFKNLQANYLGVEGVTLINAAIAESEGVKPFYYIRENADTQNMPSWYDELGSFRKDVVLKHRDEVPDLEKNMVVTEVECKTFEGLCTENGFEQVDLVHIDTEGYDYEIIKTINFERWKPQLLIYEHKHLSNEDEKACTQLVTDAGYRCYKEKADTWCVLFDEGSEFSLAIGEKLPRSAWGKA